MRKTTSKRMIGFLLTAVMFFSLMPTMPLRAYATSESDTTPPVLTTFSATVNGEDRESSGGTLDCIAWETVTSVKVIVSEAVTVSGTPQISISGGSIPAGAVYGTASPDAEDADGKTIVITPGEGYGTITEAGTYTLVLAAGSVEDAAGNENAEICFYFDIAKPGTVYVDDDYTSESCGGHTWGIDAFSSVTGAIAAVADGGTVNVAEGSYLETGEIEVTRPMTISGENHWDGDTYVENTFLSVVPPSGVTHCDTIFWVHNCQDVYISGFTLDRDVALDPSAPDAQTATSQTGVVFTGGCDFNGSIVSDCKVTGNRVVPNDNCFSALEVIQADDVVFERNIVEGVVNADEFAADVFYDGGIGELGGCEDIVIRDNYIDGLGAEGSPRGGDGISCVMAGEVLIEGNVVTGCRYGIYENQVSLTITGNKLHDNDIGVQCGAWTMELHQNAIYDNGYNISCGYTEAEKVDALKNYWGLFSETAIKASCDGNVGVAPWATDDERDGNGNFKYLSVFTFTFADGKATVASYTGTDAAVYIPDVTTDNGTVYPVTAIGNDVFKDNATIHTVDIPDSVTAIGDSTFKGSTLQSVVIPDSVTTIGGHAFEDCTGLTDLTISKNVTVYNECAFNNIGITSLVIPDGVTAIGNAAFAFCMKLESVEIPSSVESLADGSFFDGAFSDCENLKSVVIHEGNLHKIGDWTFTYCMKLESVSLPSNITAIGDCAFNTTAIKTLDLPDHLVTIGEQAFSDNDVIVGVEIPESVTSIGIWAFTSNDNMTDAYFFGNAPAIDKTKWPAYDPIPFGEYVTVHYAYGNTGFGYDDDGNLDHDSTKWYGSPTSVFVPVSFHLNGGSGTAVRQVLDPGDKVTKPEDPKRTSYTFGGWYASASGTGAAWDFQTQVTETTGALTLYAKWIAKDTGGGGGFSGNTGAQIIVNGETRTAGTSVTETNPSGQTVTTVTVNTDSLKKILEEEGGGANVVIPVTTGADVAAGVLTGEMVKDMEEKDATLVVRTNTMTYTIKASELDIESIAEQLGTDINLSDLTVTVEISEPSKEMAKVIENAETAGEFAVMLPAVKYEIRCTYGDKTVKVDSFDAYVERLIAIPSGVDPEKITTGIVVKPDGTTYHVPTQVVVINGVYYAKINSLTNSVYVVIWHPVEFADMANHWARAEVNEMGSRMVVSGVGENRYDPEKSITRAEFAAIVVRALGLEPGLGECAFSDVGTTDWYCGYVKTAALYGIVKGYDDGSFGPGDCITREQAMTMIARAMKLTGLKAALTENDRAALLKNSADGADVSGFAGDSVAECLKTGIVLGRDGGLIAPKSSITRAETAVIIQRLLQKSKLI